MPFIHTFDPVLVSLGPLQIRWYGLVYVFGFIASYMYLNWLIKKKRLDLSPEELTDWVFYLMIGVLLGSRIIHIIFWDPVYYFSDPIKMLYFWEGGMAFHGGFLGVVLATYYFWRYKINKRMSFFRLSDALVIPSTLALALGRIANFINGELPGKVTNVSWCWYFPGVDGCRHPQVLYSAAKRFIILGWLVLLELKGKYKDGFLSLNMIFLFGVGRFFIDFFRDDPTFLGLAAGQYLSLVMIFVGGFFLFRDYRKDLLRMFR